MGGTAPGRLATPLLSECTLPLPIGAALVLGEQLARQLARLHAQGRVHAVVRPGAVSWQASPPCATLLETDAAGPLPAPTAHTPDAPLEHLVHAAPEQTGRSQGPIDARSDLYALGVVLYAALTGAPPFVGRDALEQIHRHLAGAVPRPRRSDVELPGVVGDIVLRLLAKSPEDRYQSATALADDLARCTAQWAEHGRIEPFALARHEGGSALSFGGALVGRQREVAQLRAALARAAAGGRALVLVEGSAGIGKTALIHALVRPGVRDEGLFVSGKFDQVVRGVPFGALIQAFQALVRQLLGLSEQGLSHWRGRLQEMLGVNAGVLSEVIPEITHVIGPQPTPTPLPAMESQNRFVRVVQRFLAALASRERPLVLFLDDLQWADAATLSLLGPLATSPEIDGLVLIGAFRDATPDTAPLLARTLEALRAAGVPLERIAVGPLSQADIAQWLTDVLGRSADEVTPLAARVQSKTGGNPFYVHQFLRDLHREGLLRADAASARWHWDLAGIDAAPLSDNVVELMSRSIRRLPPGTQGALRLAACIGNRFDLQTLVLVSERPAEDIARDIARATAEGLVVATGEGHAFLHDRVQQAAYALIPGERRAAVHLAVGRLLRGRASDAASDDPLFDVVHHLNLGRAGITDGTERREVAALDLAAGRRAKSTTAYESALALFEAGLELLGPDAPAAAQRSSTDAARLRFELAVEAAECRYLTGAFEAAQSACRVLAVQAPTPVDRARVLLIVCVQLERLGHYAEALACGREALAPFDVRLPTGEADKQQALGDEVACIERLRAGRPIPQLSELPPMTDVPVRMVMSLLTTIWSSAYIAGDPTLARLISATLVRLSLEHGHCAESAYGYVTHAITVGALHGDYRAADEYGHLALAVNRTLDDRRLRAKVYQQFHGHVNFWCHPLHTGAAYAREAYAAGLDGGDFVYAGYAAGTETWAALPACDDLADFEREYAPSVARIERLGNPGFADMVRLMLAWARALRGHGAGPLSLTSGDFDEARWLARYGDARFYACIHATARLHLAALVGTPAQALQEARRAATYADALPGTVWPVQIEFWHAQALARAAEFVPAAERAALMDTVLRARQAFEARVPHNAENHRPQALLLAAERARLQGDVEAALAHGLEAVEFAAAVPSMRRWEAMAHESVARTQTRLHRPAMAALHAARARDLFVAWGANAKASALEAEWSLAPAPRAAASAPEAMEPAAPAAVEDSGMFDLASVLKASQAIGAEVRLDTLVARLLHIAIENAGAERGALVLEGEHGAVVHSVERDAAATVVEPLDASTRVPSAVVQYVRRTGETVTLGQKDAPLPAGLGDDDYLRRHAPRSLACLPVRRLSRPAGVLYVEHRGAAGLYTPARLAVLRVLATQAAMAVENARLIHGLRSEVAERTQTQRQLAGALAEVERLKDDLEAENSYLRRDLIANVSHDLRTPLVSLRGYLEMVATRGDGLDEPQRAQYLAIALRQSERLAALIDELFELARLDYRGLTLNRERFAFDELAADVVQKFRLVAESRGVTLVAMAAPGLPFVDADLGLVERVLENLIGNALKHTPAGGTVRVAARRDGDRVVAEVCDSGPGIAAADLPHVFDRHFRGASGAGDATAGGGAGLGLAIARRIIELHGGTIAAESAAEVADGHTPRGARLWFTLSAAGRADAGGRVVG